MRRSITLILSFIFALVSLNLAAQTSADFSRADKYKAVKDILRQSHPSAIDRSDKGGEGKGEYDLSSASGCSQPYDYLGSFRDAYDTLLEKPQHTNDDIGDFVLDAVNMVVWENDLRKLRVPERIWRPVLERYEAEVLSAKPNDVRVATDVHVLVTVLNERMAEAGVAAPKFVYEPGCGSGGLEVQFALKPANGQLFLIPIFLYKVCQVQHLNPLDFKSCDRWKEIFSEHVWAISGDYMYLARWTDGVVRCGSLTENDFKKTNDSATQELVITKLRSPECSPAF
jgi:hypothetical protein